MSEPGDGRKNLVIRQLRTNDKVNKLKLVQADGALGVYLQHWSHKFHLGNIAKSYVLVETDQPTPQKVWGYISLILSEIKSDIATTAEFGQEYNYHAYPAVKIARLAIDRRIQKSGWGRDLVSYTVALVTQEIMPFVGCRFITVDANRPAIEFYKKQGFTMVDTEANKQDSEPVMFMDLQKVVPVS